MPKSVFALTHDEREKDYTGTPYGLLVHSDRRDDIHFAEAFSAEEQQNILVEFPISEICAKISGYSRFVRWRKPVKGCRYGAAKFTSTRIPL